MSAPYYERARLRFECTQCGACCAGRGDDHVFLAPGEAERIRTFLGLSPAWFRHRYLHRTPDGDRVLAERAGGACVFLDGNGGCRVYPVRPVQCRTYPFWPEVVSSERAWKREARFCEGIGRGTVVPLPRIRAALRKG